MPKLESEVSRAIRDLCDHANTLYSKKEYAFALSKYFEALGLIPDPKSEYRPAAFIYSAIGEVYWTQHKYNEAGTYFLHALRSVGGDQNSQINLRLGECLYECGDKTRFREYLCAAYAASGEDAFADEDPKYFELIRGEVEGVPDDDDIEESLGREDYYLVDNMLGYDPRPAEYDDDAAPPTVMVYYDDEEDGYRPQETYSDDYSDSYAGSDDYDGDYDDADYDDADYDDDGYADRAYTDEEYDDDGYFDGEYADDDDYDDDDDGDSPVRRAVDWFINLFR